MQNRCVTILSWLVDLDNETLEEWTKRMKKKRLDLDELDDLEEENELGLAYGLLSPLGR